MPHLILYFAAMLAAMSCLHAADEAPKADPLGGTEEVAQVDPAKTEQAERLVASGLQAMQDSNEDSARIIDAALSFTEAMKIYQELGDTEKQRDMNANIFWCKKRMNLDDLNGFLAKKGNDKAVADTVAQMDKIVAKQIPKEQAGDYYARAEKFAADNKDNYLLIAIRYFEVAERFQGTEVSLKAQRQSLDAYQAYTKQAAEQAKAKRQSALFVKSQPAAEQSPVPSASDQKVALAAVKKLYKDDYAGTKENQKKACAWKLHNDSKSSDSDPVTRYVMLSEAVRLAQGIGDVRGILIFIDETAKHFAAYDPVAEKKAVLAKVKGSEAAVAVLKLLDNPDDGDANTKAGKYFCLQADDWDNGLTLLSNGADAEWKKLGEMELEKPDQTPQQLELADLWYDTAGKNKPLREPIMVRARYWYKAALPSCTGVSKARVEKRLEEIFAVVPDPDVDYDNLTAAQWDKLKAGVCAVSATAPKNDTGVTLAAGQKVRVVPHPTDTWMGNNFGGNAEPYGWRGDDRMHFMRGELQFMEMGMFLDNGKKKSLGVITGPGRLFLAADDPYHYAASGSIRVKIVPVEE